MIPDAALTWGINYDHVAQVALERAARARLAYDAWRAAQAGLPKPGTWSEPEGLLEAVVERKGRLADLLVLRHPASDVPETERAFDAAVFSTGRPCLLVREAVRHPLLDHVLVAWNGSLEGTRALAGAMPLLSVAGRVSVFSAPRPDGDVEHGRELARALARNGIEARQAPASAPSEPSVGARFLQAAETTGATLLVMGAYTHSRVRQMLLGGVTRHVLKHATVPVLMTH